MISHRWTRLLVCTMALLLVVDCSRRHALGFYNVSYRERYAITDTELRDLQFYVSEDVLVQAQAPGQSATQVFILKQGTPGMVVDAGPDWIRVVFQKGGTGARFVTDPRKAEDLYWLATETNDRPGLSKLGDLDTKVLVHDRERFAVLEGADAFLLVDRDDLDKLIKSRPHLSGVTKGQSRR